MRKERGTNLTRLIPPVVIGVAASVGTEVPTRMLESHSVGLPTLCSITVVVFGAGMWLSDRLRRIEDRLDGLPCQINGCSMKSPPKRKRKR